MKKVFLSYILIFLLIFCILEGIIRVYYGPCTVKPDFSNFEYYYIDIHSDFFKKIYRGNKLVYVPVREYHKSQLFTAKKSSDTIRIFILGGSVVRDLVVTKFENVLTRLSPGKNFEVINCGIGGYDSYRVYLVAREIINYNPDLLIVLSGNNEFYNPVKINLSIYYFNKFLRKSCAYSKFQDLLKSWHRGKSSMNYNQKRLDNYRRNIQNIVREANMKGIPIILCTIPVDIRDCPPRIERPLNKLFLRGLLNLHEDNYNKAIVNFRKFLNANPQDTFGYYFLGRVYDKMKKFRKARLYYLKSLELDSSYSRAAPIINKIIRRICIKKDIVLADIEKAFIDKVPYGLLGGEQFKDNCHWYKEYYNLMFETILKKFFKII